MSQRVTPTAPVALRRAVWIVWIVAVGLMFAPGILPSFGASKAPADVSDIVGVLLAVGIEIVIATLGALIVARYPHNLIGWIFLITSLMLGLSGGADAYATATNSAVAAWFVSIVEGPANLSSFVFIFLLFPDGRLLSPRWRPLAWSLAAACLLFTLVDAALPGPLRAYPSVSNPFGIHALSTVLDVVSVITLIILTLGLAAGAASLVVRFRRSRGDERQQLKWVASAAVAAALLSFSGPILWGDAAPIPGPITFILAAAIIPTSIGVAILKYRLYDIDLIIRRTLVYGVLTALLALAYWAIVVVFQEVLRPLTQGSDLSIVGSTLIVAALFQPVRKRIQQVVDRRFYRQRYDAARTLELFTTRLRNEVDLDSLGADLLAVVGTTMQPQRVSLWLRPPAEHKQ